MEQIQRCAIIGLVNLIFYWKAIYYGYVGDDVERSERKQEFKNVFHRWWIQFIGLKHTHPMVAHFISIVTHTICCMMIYLSLGQNNISFWAAILFSLNPTNLQGSVWISGRNYVTSAILALSMFLIPQFSWVGYAATSHFAVNAWFAPLAFLGTKHWYMVGIIPVVWLVTANNRDTFKRKVWDTGGVSTTNSEMRAVKLRKIIPFVKTHLYYFILSVVPYNISIEHNFLRGLGTNDTDNKRGYKIDGYFLLGLVLLGLIGKVTVDGIMHGWNPIGWGLFWFTINIAMWCNFITIQQQIAERYMYLANIGMMYALAALIHTSPIATTAFIVGYAIRTWYVMEMYVNDYWVVEHSLVEIKDMHYMWLMRGVKKFMVKNYVGALYDFHEAYIHKPYDLKILYNLATTHFLLGNAEKAREFLEKAKANIYDELESEVKPAFDSIEEQLKKVEEAKLQSKTNIQVDLKNIMVVK